MTGDASVYDVVVVGSGAGGMVAALRAHDLGLKSILIEKHYRYGGTSATSGGSIWVPLNDGVSGDDTLEKALEYLRNITNDQAHDPSLRIYVETAYEMVKYVRSVGVKFAANPAYADYFSERPGSASGRVMQPDEFDGKKLGNEFFRMREGYPIFTGFGRYALSRKLMGAFIYRSKGWKRESLRMVAAYWLDVPWRLKTRKDSKLTAGRGLIGALRKAMLDRGVPLVLNTKLVAINKDGDRVTGIEVECNGTRSRIAVRSVILASGGFEQNQEMRDRYLPVKTQRRIRSPPVMETREMA